ncbi:MAG: spore germination protein [Oscillospiraceae bacterium]
MDFLGKKREGDPPHPRKVPQFDLPLNTESMEAVFDNCVDFAKREIALGGDREKTVVLCTIGSMVKTERVNDYVLRPLAQDGVFAAVPLGEAYRLMAGGALYNLSAREVGTVDDAAGALIDGACLLLFPPLGKGLALMTATEEKRAVSTPQNEPAVKGAQDSFVESVRTNTSLVRRRLRSPTLKMTEHIVGRQTRTPIDVLYLAGIANPETVRLVEERIGKMDTDAVLAAGDLEQYLTDEGGTAFPLMPYTQRPDRFCAGLCQGRVGVLADGLPIGYLLPGTAEQFFKTEQDRSNGWILAGVLTVLRYLCVLVTLFLPGIYIAAVTFHPEMIPTRLALSILAAREDVPFGALLEVFSMLVAFEVLQEAGLRLPASIGQTVSILGGLVVGSAAVEAKIVSPAVLIVVALAGIAGYTQPNQDFAGALRLWRFGLAAAAGLGGFLGLTLGAAVLTLHLAGIETFSVPYLAPFAARDGTEEGLTLMGPLPERKYRPGWLKTKNRRKQK